MRKLMRIGLACACALAAGGAWGAPERPKKDVEVVAVYYPHWHKYPKGTEWFGAKWDAGEWDFVKTARALFPGHKQPLRPYPGYLDGADPKDMETEIALAANAGIDVFLWDYYWYGGKVTQEESIEKAFLKARNRGRMKFALMWCYHERNNQFRPHLEPSRQALMTLDHTPEEFLGLIDHSIARYFNQPEYWRKDGKLFFSIYNVSYLWETWGKDAVKVRAALDEARRRVRAAGLGELHLNAQNLRPEQVPLAVEMGFDSLTDYNLTCSYAPNFWKRYVAGERLFAYDEIGEGIQKRWKAMQATALPYFPNVTTGWDATPRCRLDAPFPWPKTAHYPYCATLTNNTPDRFEQYLRAAKAHVLADPKKPGVVYVNAWNEYTEGCYLLPNNFDADGFLRAVAAVFDRTPANEYTYVNPSTKQLLTVPAATHENVAYGPHPKQKVDVFLPPQAKGPVPVVVYLHGGGWTGGAMVDHIVGAALRPLLARGVAVVAVGYRYIGDARLEGVVPPVKACLDDCEAAVRFVKAHAKDWNLDVSRLALAGGSAGACTALYLGLKDDNALGITAVGPIIAQTSLDPRETRAWIPNATYGAHAFGFRNFDDWLANRERVLPWIARFSPAALAGKIAPARAPKMFLQYGSLPKPGERAQDPTHSGAFGLRFKEICDARGIPCEVFTDARPSFGATFLRLADALQGGARQAAVDPAAFISAALARGEKTIRVPKGVYEVAPGEVASVYLKGVQGVTVDFQGSELRGRTRSALVTLRDCTGVTVKNATLDYPFNLPFTQGFVEAVGPDGEWDVRIAQGYPDPADGRWGWPVQAYDAKTGDLVNPMRYLGGIKVVRTAPGRWRVTGGTNRRGKVGDIAVWSFPCETRGDAQSAETRAHAVYLLNCAGCRMENVTVYATPGSNGFRELLGAGGNAYVACHVVPRPPETDPVRREIRRFRSGNHDAFNSRAVRKGPALRDCTARNHCDDDLNIHGPYQFIASAAGATVRAFVRDMYVDALRVGDPVQLVTAEGYSPAALLRIVALKPATPTAEELERVKKGLVDQIARACNTMREVTFERADPVLKPGTLFVSMNAAGSGFRVENCRFGPNRARGFISNASFGEVVGCTFDRTESYGVLSRPSYQWLEGGASRNVRFKDCTFIDCGVFYGVHREMLTTNECHRNIVFAGCRFKGPRARLEVQGCTGLELSGNTFDVPEEKAVALTKVVREAATEK